ncbi:hypothetical protein [Amaricoccus tamworthensis]|uniref:hypothetical protein n=1 Tax=Amaricoccus tamworthensis TaxID=57002 RepID=UPI003C7C272F
MNTVLLLVAVSLMTLAGDYFIKLASSRPDGLNSVMFVTGALLYGLPAFGWFFLMRSHSLAAVAVFYSASTLLLMAALGHVVFREPLGLREIIGGTLAIMSVAVMSWET